MNDLLSLYLAAFSELVTAKKRSTATLSFCRKKAAQLIRVLEHMGDANNPRAPFPLSSMSAAVVDGYISQRRQEGVEEGTIKKELSVLRGALKLALRRGLWNGNLLAVLPQGFSDGYVPRERALTWEEVDKLIEALSEKRAAHIAFIVATGASWGESCRAERQDVNTDYTEANIRGTKNVYRKRTVPIIAAQQKKLLKIALEKAPNKEGVLFAKWLSVRRDLALACEKAKIETCTPNDLRRTFATRLHAMGVSLDLLAPPMGHSDTRMLERVYGRLPIGDLAESMKRAIARGQEPRVTTNVLQSNRETMGKVLLQKGVSGLVGALMRSENPRAGGSTPSLGNPQNPLLSNQDAGFVVCAPSNFENTNSPDNPQNPSESIASTTNLLHTGLYSQHGLDFLALELLELAEMGGKPC